TTLKAIELIAHSPDLIRKLQDNTLFFRKEIEEAGFDIRPGSHPIIPIMLGEEHLAKTMADKLLAEGVYVIGFSHPVVPRGQARIRVQISAVHEREDIDQAVAAFQKIGRELGVIT
ncbi:MAG: aminotransferase class I/II-fold pyridoxal phosphate-dependent enzyme, partial [Nitrospinaceae bacterium]|nr:aminotransferase class I/II-fold pyridoxal phosphate-dependent enzyme [Nitrospinaceae bacterium]